MTIRELDLTAPKAEGNYAIMFHMPSHCAGCKKALEVLKAKKLENWTIELVDAEDKKYSDVLAEMQPQTAPTIVVFENGVETERLVGLKNFLENHNRIFGE